MSLMTLKSRRAKIAEKDIIVYKRLNKDKTSEFQGFKYVKNRLYEKDIIKSDDMCCFDNLDKGYLESHFNSWEHNPKLVSYGIGFHSALNKERYGGDIEDMYIAKFIIPKGAKYILGFTDLLISNQIIRKT